MMALAIAAMVWIATSASSRAQDAMGSNATQSSGSTRLTNTDVTPELDATAGRETVMSAAQLIRILRNNPEVMVEVKPVVSDAAQGQGVSVQPDALTDEQVYSQIESSRDLRASLTQFLRARGYVTEEEIGSGPDDVRQNLSTALTGATDINDVDALELESARDSGATNSYGESLPRPLNSRAGVVNRRQATLPDQNRIPAPNVTDVPEALHRPTPYNLLSLRDLYTQAPDSPEHLKRFGSELFVSSDRTFAPESRTTISALDVPIGPEYVLGPGDELSITLWGGVSQNLLRMVDREGRVALPEAGPLQVAGLSMADAESLIGNALQPQYRNAHVAVTVSHLRSIRIFVVGDVQRPGSYELSALASPISALFACGGPTGVGSLRVLRHFRNQKLIGEIDLYDFMLHGIRPTDDRLQSGDTLLVPPVGPQVAIFGAVKRPAIYELRDEKDLAEVVENAGGLTVAAALAHITIDRMITNQHREQIAVEAGADGDPLSVAARLQATGIKDGDRVHVGTLLPASERVVYVQGHVARPGKIPYRDNMRIGDVLRSYQDLLPEPAVLGQIVRLVAPDLHPETMDFSVPDVLIGNSPLTLQPFDTIEVFGRYELDAPTVSIRGEVQKPGTYPLFEGMTAAQLVRTAGGFKRDALVARADLASYRVVDGTRVSVERRDVTIGDAVMKRDPNADAPLKPGDVLTIHQLTGWNDIGASIIIEGEVAHPGSYGFQEGEHLSDVLRRAGGFRPTAYPEGAVLTRPDVASLEEKSRQELIRQIETSSAAARLSPAVSTNEQSAALQAMQREQDQIIAQLRSQPATGRLVIRIDSTIENWAGTPADIEVRSGDVLRIPKRPGFVLVDGQVYNPSAITYMPDKSAGWYLQRAGGTSATANRKEIFVIRANGAVIGRRSGNWYERDVLSTRLNPGDTIVVPQKITGPSVTWRNLLAAAQVSATIAIAAAVAGL